MGAIYKNSINYSNGGGSVDAYTKSETDALLNDKQDVLISGYNIKNINGQRLLGDGNLEIESGNANLNLDTITETAFVSNDTESIWFVLADEKLIVSKPNEYYKELSLGGAPKSYVDTQVATKQDTLVSGTNIKTINNESILGTGNITISGGQAVWGSITGNIADQTDLVNNFADKNNVYNKTQIDGMMTNKQNTLVSGSNIKSVNGQSLLGSGDLSITGSEYIIDLSSPQSLVDIDEAYQDGRVFYAKYQNKIYPVNGLYTDGNALGEEGHVYFVCLLSQVSTLDVTINYYDGIREVEAYPLNLATPSDLNNKQNTLVSGTNIKTINNESVLGSGNLNIPIGVNFEVGVEKWYGTFKENGVTYQTYTKTIFIPALSSTAGITTYDHGINNIKQILGVFGFGTNGFVLNSPRQNAQDNIAIYQVSKSATNKTFSIEVGKDRSNMGAYVTLIYAKNN